MIGDLIKRKLKEKITLKLIDGKPSFRNGLGETLNNYTGYYTIEYLNNKPSEFYTWLDKNDGLRNFKFIKKI